MNTLLIIIVAFSIGLGAGMTLFGCPGHAFDDEQQERRIGEGNWWEFQRQQQEMDRYQREQRRNPCP